MEKLYFDSPQKIYDLKNQVINQKVLDLITKEYCIKNILIPFDFNKDELKIAMFDTENIKIIDELKFLTKYNIKVFKSSKEEILSCIRKNYSKCDVRKALKDFGKEYSIIEEKKEKSYKDLIKDAPAVRLTESIIMEAVEKKASDIHIEPFNKKVLIRYRIDGVMINAMEFPKEYYSLICSRIKIISNMNISNSFVPQDGKFSMKIDVKNYDFRVSSIPTVYGENICIRILYKSDNLISLDSIRGVNKSNINDILKYSRGLILITGPTGSGKTTTLYSILNSLDKVNKNIITIEDPVEYTIPKVNQVNVNNKVGLTFSRGLRNILRQDPDIIMVGEIRDEETAEIATRASITGHLVLSSLHTYDAISTISRLKDMGIPSYIISDSLSVIVSQRLVRTICPYCKKTYLPKKADLQLLNSLGLRKLYKGTGCERCNYTGYMGRTAVYEVLKLNKQYKNAIIKEENIESIRELAYKKGFIDMKTNCTEFVKKGITTFDELYRIINDTY